MRFIISLLTFAMLAKSAALSQVVRGGDTNHPKGIAWSSSKPGIDGVETSAVEALYAEITEDQHHDLKGIVILRDGHLLSERYFNGDRASTLHDIRSATKSITALLMGIAIRGGLVHSVNDSIARYLPGLPADGKEKITIKDLLNMRSGLDADDDDPKTPGDVSSAHDPYADYYGYMWYTKAEPVGHGTVEVHFASGNGGNKAYVIPSLHMVVAITSSAYSTNYGQRRSQDLLLKILSATHDH